MSCRPDGLPLLSQGRRGAATIRTPGGLALVRPSHDLAFRHFPRPALCDGCDQLHRDRLRERVLDIIAAVCPESPYQAEIRNRLGIARELMETDSIFNDKARQYLSFAYRMMTDGRKYAFPGELDQFVTPAEAQEKARSHATRLVDKAVGELNAGRPAETARLLLELVLMIVTPVKGWSRMAR